MKYVMLWNENLILGKWNMELNLIKSIVLNNQINLMGPIRNGPKHVGVMCHDTTY